MMFAFREDVEAGGLVAYGASLSGQYRQAATFVHKILSGARPVICRSSRRANFEFVINVKTAKKLGLLVPSPVLLRADQVVES